LGAQPKPGLTPQKLVKEKKTSSCAKVVAAMEIAHTQQQQ